MNSKIFTLTLVVLINICHAQQLKLKWSTDTVFRVPESVLHDDRSNILYVSNINGKSSEKDGNGFISKLTTDGKVQVLEFATGLNAPKGMGLLNNALYVADLTRVVVIDVTTGRIINTFEIEGAQVLNDITIDKKGIIYISDSSTGKIHQLFNNSVSTYFEGQDFKRVNGLLAIKRGLYAVNAGTGINYIIDKKKNPLKYTETSQSADGVVSVGNNAYIVSSWAGEVYYVNKQAKVTKILDTKDQKLNSADIAYDAKTKTLFVPTFYGNKVMAYEFIE